MDSVKYQIKTFGCKVNLYDTGLLQKNLSHQGFSLESDSDVFVFNTCAVTGKATQEAVKEIKRLKKNRPTSKVVVTGCSAQVDTEYFSEMDQVDLVIANSHKSELPRILKEFLNGQSKEKVYKSNIFKSEELGLGGGRAQQQTRSFLKIQDGCNSFCTFCIIPFARGKSRSLPVEKLVTAVQSLADQGVLEVVLTGVHIGDYFDEEKKIDLASLVKHLLEVTTVKRLRLSSLEPIEVTPAILSLYQSERMCPHFHLSMQSCNSEVLKLMKRNYGEKEVRSCLETIKNLFPHAYVGMDVITGFADETEEQHQQTMQVLRETSWTKIHVFPYSRRKGTYADRSLQHHSHEVAKWRAAEMRELSLERESLWARQQLGEVKQVLTLKSGDDGLSTDYWPVKILHERPLIAGQEWAVRITAENFSEKLGNSRYLTGELLTQQV